MFFNTCTFRTLKATIPDPLDESKTFYNDRLNGPTLPARGINYVSCCPEYHDGRRYFLGSTNETPSCSNWNRNHSPFRLTDRSRSCPADNETRPDLPTLHQDWFIGTENKSPQISTMPDNHIPIFPRSVYIRQYQQAFPCYIMMAKDPLTLFCTPGFVRHHPQQSLRAPPQ